MLGRSQTASRIRKQRSRALLSPRTQPTFVYIHLVLLCIAVNSPNRVVICSNSADLLRSVQRSYINPSPSSTAYILSVALASNHGLHARAPTPRVPIRTHAHHAALLFGTRGQMPQSPRCWKCTCRPIPGRAGTRPKRRSLAGHTNQGMLYYPRLHPGIMTLGMMRIGEWWRKSGR